MSCLRESFYLTWVLLHFKLHCFLFLRRQRIFYDIRMILFSVRDSKSEMHWAVKRAISTKSEINSFYNQNYIEHKAAQHFYGRAGKWIFKYGGLYENIFLGKLIKSLHMASALLVSKEISKNIRLGSECGSVSRAVASETRGPRFESSHWPIYFEKLGNYFLTAVLRRRK